MSSYQMRDTIFANFNEIARNEGGKIEWQKAENIYRKRERN